MYALSKTRIESNIAQALIDAHFGKGVEIRNFIELTDGMYNAAYLIELSDDQKLVLKIAPADHIKVLRYEKEIMRAEVDVLRLIHAQTEVPVPEVFAYDTSRQLIDHDYFLMSFVPGTGLHKLRAQLSAQEQQSIDFGIGEYLRQINQIQGPAFGYFAQPDRHFSAWREAFSSMLTDLLQDGVEAGVDLGVDPVDLLARLQPFLPLLDDVKIPSLVHWDCWDGNIFVDQQTQIITGILDCERALWGDPLMEVNFGAFGVQPALVRGYGVDLLTQPGGKERRALYNIYLWLVMIIECTYRRYETQDQENWARMKLIEELQILQSL